MESDLVSQLEDTLRNLKDMEEANQILRDRLSDQQAKIVDYENEVEGAKNHMLQLETLVQQVQENTIKEQLMKSNLSAVSMISCSGGSL